MAKHLAIVVAVFIATLAGCRDNSATRPTGAQMAAEQARAKAQVASGKRKLAAVAEASHQAEEASFAQRSNEFTYESDARRDPFQPYHAAKQAAVEPGAGPLEQFDLEQLSVVALVWSRGKARALVGDPAGTTYPIGMGSRMGKNAGRVTHIGDNLVLVKETYVDYAGEQSTKDVELRIRRSEGG